jgi:hypothetical protein
MTDAEHAALPTVRSADEYVAAIRDTVGHLVAMDVRTGGNQASRHATRALHIALRRLDSGTVTGPGANDVRAAVAELAELTGWLLIDANRHEPARRANQLALALARAAGDRSMELFVTHNISLQATYLRRPGSRPGSHRTGVGPKPSHATVGIDVSAAGGPRLCADGLVESGIPAARSCS